MPAAWWGLRLWADIPTRAFDPSDPSQQLDEARGPADQFRAKGPLGWMTAVISDPGAKPVQTALMSGLFLAGLPPDHVGYEVVLGFFVIALLVGLEALLLRERGETAALVFAALALGSNVVLQQALYGGHSWIGQAFLWLAAGLWIAQGPPVRPRRAFWFGLLLGASMLASYHMAPMILALVAAWCVCLASWSAWRGQVPLGPCALALLGFLLLLAFFESATFAIPKHHYWETLSWQFTAARNVPKTYRDAGFYFYDLLRTCEAASFAGAWALLAAAGAIVAARRSLSEAGSWPWLVLPAAALAFAQAPTTIKLERTCLPAVIALLPLAAIGADAALRRCLSERWRLPAAAALCAGLLGFSAGARAQTWTAFHAGRVISDEIRTKGGDPDAVVVGLSLPYIYQPERELRVHSLAQLRQAQASGRDWALLSYLSPWWWNSFLPSDKFDIPVHDIFDSGAPYVAVPGVESSSFQLFSNETQYHLVKTGQMPFPVENRLYRISDILAVAQKSAPAGAR